MDFILRCSVPLDQKSPYLKAEEKKFVDSLTWLIFDEQSCNNSKIINGLVIDAQNT